MEQNNKYCLLTLTGEQKQIVLAALKCLLGNYEDKMSAYRFSPNALRNFRQEYKTTKEIKAVLETQELVECTNENPFAWHSVDELPPFLPGGGSSADVLVVDKYDFTAVAWLNKTPDGTAEWRTRDDSFDVDSIVAWQAIEPYKAEEEKK